VNPVTASDPRRVRRLSVILLQAVERLAHASVVATAVLAR
jgi:hypothetical protein